MENGAAWRFRAPLRRGQFRLEPIPLLLESVPLLAAVLRTLLQTRNLRVLLLDVSSQPADLGLQVFDPFPHGQAEHSHPRYDSRGDGFCPVAFDGVPVSAASDPLNNYLEFYKTFAPLDDQRNAENPWIEAETFFETRYPKVGKGSYGWAHPLIMKSNGIPNERPTFRHLAEAVDKNSIFLDRYYAFATSKTHGEFILGFAGIRPAHARVISIDSYSVGNIGSVLEFMTPLFKEILRNACGSCPKPEHIGILRIIEAFILKIDSAITAIKSSNPAIHGKDYGHGGRSSA